MSTKSVLATIATLTAVVIAANEYDRKISPFLKIAKDWDATDGLKNVRCPGKVINTLRNYFFVTDECPATTFLLFKSDKKSVEKPQWIADGIQEVLKNYTFPLSVSDKARFAAKYATVQMCLSKEAQYAVKVIGTAYFEQRGRLTGEQLTLLRRALIYYLKTGTR